MTAGVTYDGSTLILNMDGGAETVLNSSMSGDINDYSTTPYLHKYTNITMALNKSFTGSFDDFRISNTARSADWIKAVYYSETDALVAWGAEEELSGPADLKSVNSILKANVKSINSIAIADVKSVNTIT